MSTTQVNIHQAKTQLSKLIAELDEGDEVVIANRGKPVARLTPFVDTGRRPLGSLDLGPLDEAFDAAMAPLKTDEELDEIGWPH